MQVPALRGDELDQLARDLGHAERAKRERAYQQFLDSGPDALRSLLTRRQDDNPEWVRMANQLLAAIQDKHGIRPTRFDGLEFLPFVDPVWRIPPPGGHTPINLGVNVTNLRDEPFRFFMKRTISPHFGGFGVPPLQGGGGGDNIDRRTDYWSPPLAKGQSVTVSDFEAKLCWSADGKELRLRGKTDACTFFGYGPLKPGRYYLWFTCDCTYERWGQPVAILFDGADIPLTRSRQTSTQFITFEIK